MADESEKLANEFYRGQNTLGKPTRLSLTGTEPATPAGMSAGGVPAAATAGTSGGAAGGAPAIAGAGKAGDSALLNAITGVQQGLGGVDTLKKLSGGGLDSAVGSGGPNMEADQNALDPGRPPVGNVDAGTPTSFDQWADPELNPSAGIDPTGGGVNVGGAVLPIISSLFNIGSTIAGNAPDALKGVNTASAAATGAAGAAEALGLATSGLGASIAPVALTAQMAAQMIDQWTRGDSSKWINEQRRVARQEGAESAAFGESAWGSDPIGLRQNFQSQWTPDGLMEAIKGARVNPGGDFGFNIAGKQLSDMAFPEIVAALEGGGHIAGGATTAGGESFGGVADSLANTLQSQIALLSTIDQLGGMESPQAQPYVQALRSQMESVDQRVGRNTSETNPANETTDYPIASQFFDTVKNAGPDEAGGLLGGEKGYYSFGIGGKTLGPDAQLSDVLSQLQAGGHLTASDWRGRTGGFGEDAQGPHTRDLRYLSMLEEDRLRQGMAPSAAPAATTGADNAAAAPADGGGGMDLAAPVASGQKFPWDEA